MRSRLVWLAAGLGIGVTIARRVERSGHSSPATAAAAGVEAAAANVARRARRVVDAVIADGRAEMRTSEARLRAVLAAPRSSIAAEE